jgi:hypothetical protein
MSSDRAKGRVSEQRMTMRVGGRYLRFSWKYNTWQVQTRYGDFRNVNLALARCYATMGFPIEPEHTNAQQEIF